jgi:SAM-dependent methyltransferase
MDNYQYCAQFAVRMIGDRLADAKVLDYGCGAGQIVKLLRDAGISAFGCETFYGGGVAKILDGLEAFILPMKDAIIPFPDNTFDLVINNQVMEHVEDIDLALAEIHRTLKPGGTVLSLFPDRSVWREGHCGVPLLHRFPKRSTPRIYYALLMRTIGLGYHTKGGSRLQWSKDFCDWLDNWTVYRRYDAIARAYGKFFSPMNHIEDEWLEKRLGPAVRPFPAWSKRLFARKMAGMIFTCTKPPVQSMPTG